MRPRRRRPGGLRDVLLRRGTGATNSGTIPCNTLTTVAAELGVHVSELDDLSVGAVSAPISVNGNYLLVQLTNRTPTPYAEAEAAVAQAVQQAGSSATQRAITAAERRSSVSVDPRYGVWVPVQASVFTPFTPAKSDVLNPSANEAARPASAEPDQRLTVPSHRPHITVVGLGPAGTDLLGDRAARLLAVPGRAYLRTARHPAAARRSKELRSFDDLYESAATFDEVYAGIVEALVAAALDAAPEPVVYAVPGSPLVAERSVELLRADDRVEVTVVPALSFLDLAWSALGIDPLAEGVRLVDAGAFGSVAADEGGPFLVAQCWSRHVLSDVKLALRDDDGPALPRPVILHHLGLDDEVVAAVDWWELDRTVEPDHLTSLYVPALADGGRLPPAAEVARLVAPHGHACASAAPGTGRRPTPR